MFNLIFIDLDSNLENPFLTLNNYILSDNVISNKVYLKWYSFLFFLKLFDESLTRNILV